MIRSIRIVSRYHYENLGGMKMTENGNSKTSNSPNDDSLTITINCRIKNNSKSGRGLKFFLEVLKAFNSNFYYALLLDIILLPLLIISTKLLYIIKPVSGKLLEKVSELQMVMLVALILPIIFYIIIMIIEKTPEYIKNILKIVIAFANLFLLFKIISQIGNSIEHSKYNLDMNYLIFFSYLTSYLVVDFVRNLIVKLKNWIFSDSSNDELVKNKLSFINKIIVGFLSVVATIISILISLKQLH